MTSIPNFADVPLAPCSKRETLGDWQHSIQASQEELVWRTPEQIPVRALYTAADLDMVDHLETMVRRSPGRMRPLRFRSFHFLSWATVVSKRRAIALSVSPRRTE